MDNVTPLRPVQTLPPATLHDAVLQAWEDFAADRLDITTPDGCITPEGLGFEAWMRLPEDRRTNEYLFALGAYASKILDEKQHHDNYGKPFDLASVIIGIEYSYAGILGDPAAMDTDELEILTDDIIAAIPTPEILTALKQALKLAIPTVIKEAINAEQARIAT